MICIMCRRGLHNACYGQCECTHKIEAVETVSESSSDDGEFSNERRTGYSRRHKLDSSLRDQQSTGRKRAAKLNPLDRTADCEWANKKDIGGGSHPILGCGFIYPTGKQQAIHHGPDKNTLNNDPDNLHRICHKCHNTWHSKNDKDYVPGKPLRSD